jgi:hypothetical protein
MEIWLEIQKHQNNTRQVILSSFDQLLNESITSQLLYKSSDFLQVLISSIFSLNYVCDITLKNFMKVFQKALIKNLEEIDSDDQRVETKVQDSDYISFNNTEREKMSIETSNLFSLNNFQSFSQLQQKENVTPSQINTWRGELSQITDTKCLMPGDFNVMDLQRLS